MFKGLTEKEELIGIPLVVHWLRLHTSNAGGPGSISSQGARSDIATTKSPHEATKIPRAVTKIPHVTTETQCNQMHIHTYLYFKKKEKEELNKPNVKVLSLKEKKGKKPCAS